MISVNPKGMKKFAQKTLKWIFVSMTNHTENITIPTHSAYAVKYIDDDIYNNNNIIINIVHGIVENKNGEIKTDFQFNGIFLWSK